jgi:hypothetical protein
VKDEPSVVGASIVVAVIMLLVVIGVLAFVTVLAPIP